MTIQQKHIKIFYDKLSHEIYEIYDIYEIL